MTSSVQTMISSINRYQDLQRQSRFKVFFPSLPGCCPKLADLSLRCESVDLPGRSFNTFEHRTYGPVIKYPTQTFFNEITLTFICSSNRAGTFGVRDDLGGRVGGISRPLTGMDEKVTFENWMNYINTYPERSGKQPDVPYHNFRYRSEYVADMSIMCYDTHDVPAYEMYFQDAYPLIVNPVSMTWANEDVARLTVVFTYEYFRYTNMCECPSNEDQRGRILYTSTQQEIGKTNAQRQGPPITPETAESIPEVAQDYGAGLVQPGVGPIAP